MTAAEFLSSFVKEKLDGDISLLAKFPLGNLRNDKVYGCPGRNFDSDDTELMRAIYCVVFGETWKNLSIENAGCGKLWGDTLNTNHIMNHKSTKNLTQMAAHGNHSSQNNIVIIRRR